MEILFSFLASIVQLAVLVGIVWAIVRAVGRRGEGADEIDKATAIRRLFVYGLLFATLVLAATGVTLVLQELTGAAGDRADDDRAPLALGLAFGIVAGPAYALLLRHARVRLRETPGERQSFGWVAYLNLSLVVSLVVATATGQQALESVTGVDDFEFSALMPFFVWAAVWATHWFALKARYGLPGDLHLAAGSLAGLVPLVVGATGLAYVAGDEIYTRVVERVPVGHDDPDIRSWAIAAGLGALVWGWHWLGRYLGAERTPLWHVYVVLVGALAGLVATVISAATILYATLVWFLGDPDDTLSSEHFEFVPVAAAILVVGIVAWRYHRDVLGRGPEIERSEPLRAYDYLVAGAGLVATVVGVTLALVALLESVTPDPVGAETAAANRLLLACTLGVISAPLWWVAWSRIGRSARAAPADELRSAVRRIHLIVLFGVGGVVVLGALIGVLFVGFEDLLDGTFGGTTVRSARVGLALVVSVTGVAWYHLGVFRSDRETLGDSAPPPPPPIAPPTPSTRVVLVAPPGTALAEELSRSLGCRVERWDRTDDDAAPAVDVEDLAGRIRARRDADVLVVVGGEGAVVVPFAPGSR